MRAAEHAAVEPATPQSFDFRQIPFLEHVGIRSIDVRKGWSRVELVVLPQHLRSFGIVHGGVLATLLDSAMGMAASTLASSSHGVVTVQLNANFVRPAREGETLVATGEVKHAGRRTAVTFGEIYTAAGVLVASGSATFMHRPPGDASDPFGPNP
jgi:uncharacterized protein (TIGR00369 family)